MIENQVHAALFGERSDLVLEILLKGNSTGLQKGAEGYLVTIEMVTHRINPDLTQGGDRMEIKRILWPTDFSSRAETALPYVTSLTEKYQTEIHVLYVTEDLGRHESWYGEFEQAHMDKITAFEQKLAHQRLDQTCDKYLDGCPLYIKHTALGDPAREILKLIESEKIDMVVMASRGQKGQFDFGSVAEKVVKHAPVPVVTIPVNA